MSKDINNYADLIFNHLLFKSIIAFIPAGALYYLSYTLPFIFSFSFAWQFIIPIVAITATCIACHEYFFATFKNLQAIFTGQEDVQLFDMSFLITLSSFSSIIYALILGASAPLVLYIAPLITVAAINFSKYLKDIINIKLANETESKLQAFKKILPSKARLEQIKVGQTLIIKHGEIIEADGHLESEEATIRDYTIKTGEIFHSAPIKAGAEVSAGTRNISGADIKVKVSRNGVDSDLYKIIQSLEQEKDKTENNILIDQISSYFIPFVLIVAAITLVVWWYIAGFTLGFGYMMDVIFAACPCALGLANLIPFSILKNKLFTHNIYVYKDQIISGLPLVDTIVFDKTGTLTYLNLEKINHKKDYDPLILEHLLEVQRLRISTDNYARASDPFANAIIDNITQSLLKKNEHSNSYHYTVTLNEPHGISAIIINPNNSAESTRLYTGSKEFLADQGFDFSKIDSEIDMQISTQDKLVVYVGIETLAGKELVASLAFKQQIRPDAKEAIEQLQNSGINIWMLTGDAQEPAAFVAEQLGIQNFEAECSPDRKQEIVNQLVDNGLKVVVVGDGFNDMKQAKAANIGSIAIGKHSVMSGFFDITIESLLDIPKLIPLAEATNNNQLQLFWFCIGYNLLAIILAAIVLPLTGSGCGMMMGCFGICMAFSSLFALCWAYWLVYDIDSILNTEGINIDAINNDEFSEISEPSNQVENIAKTYHLGETNYPTEYNQYEFSIAIQFPCSGCINKFDPTTQLHALNVESYERINTVDYQTIIKFTMITNNPGIVLESLNRQFNNKNIIKDSLKAEFIKPVEAPAKTLRHLSSHNTSDIIHQDPAAHLSFSHSL